MKTYSFLLRELVVLKNENNELIQAKLLGETLYKDYAIYRYLYKGNTHYLEIHGENSNIFFSCIENYLECNPYTPKEIRNISQDEDGFYKMRWIFENNSPVYTRADITSVSEYIDEENQLHYEIDYKMLLHTYKTKEECLAYNRVIAFDNLGEPLNNNTGYMEELIIFTPEQQKAIEQLNEAIAKVRETMTIVAPNYGQFCVINGKNIKLDDYDWCNYDHNDLQELYLDKLPVINLNSNTGENPAIVIE